MRPGLRWLLIGSLAMNLAVLGIVAGAMLSGRDGGGPHRGIDIALGPFARALSDDDRRAVMRDLRQDGRLQLPSRGDRNRNLAQLVSALRTEPFDPASLSALLNGQRDRALSVQATTQDALINRIAAMTPAARAAFADRLEAELRSGGPGAVPRD
jgi:uncharacterized membrane protein